MGEYGTYQHIVTRLGVDEEFEMLDNDETYESL